jgi:hypothetical protein
MLWLALLLALPCGGQQGSQQQQIPGEGQGSGRPAHQGLSDVDRDMGGEVGSPVFEEKRLRQLGAAQHKAMVDDADKLLKLVTELNAEISITTPNSLTPEELRKVAEIEKLAHSVKDKMRNSLVGTPVFQNTMPDIPSYSRH